MARCAGLLLLAFALSIGGAALAGAMTGDPVRGEQVYHRCQGCHSIDRNRIGPMHKGLFGRAAGSVPDFDYSAAMKASGIVWSEVTLDQFLQGPRKMVPGTKMTFIGVPAAKDRADLIAYLMQATKP
jgi:cytochrome c